MALSDDHGRRRVDGARHQLVGPGAAVRCALRADDGSRVCASCRLLVGRAAAAGVRGGVVPCRRCSSTNLPNLRDYAKAPFTLALVFDPGRPGRPAAGGPATVLLLSLCYGLVLGIGYGFRTDLLIDIPPFLIAMALFMPGGVLRDLPMKIGGRRAVCAPASSQRAGRSSRRSPRSGGCQWHLFLLGFTASVQRGARCERRVVRVGASLQGRISVGDGLELRQPVPSGPGLHRILLARIRRRELAYLRRILLTISRRLGDARVRGVLHVLDLHFANRLPFESRRSPYRLRGDPDREPRGALAGRRLRARDQLGRASGWRCLPAS